MPLPRRRRPLQPALFGAVLALVSGGACGGGSAGAAVPRDWPPGTVLAVDGVAITAAEVDRDSAVVLPLALDSTERDLRRKALMNLTLPRVIGRLMAGERLEQARARAERARALLVAGQEPAPGEPPLPPLVPLHGGYGNVGLALWGAALETEVGSWTPLVEADGAFWCARVTARHEYRMAAGTTVELECLRVPFLDDPDPAGAIEAEKDRRTLVIVDPAWRRIVPELTQYRMGAQP